MNKVLRRQSGFGLSHVFFGGIAIALIAILAMKAVPSFIKYQSVMTAIKRIAADAGSNGTVAKVRSDFIKQMDIDGITSITPEDLDIYKEDNQIIIAFTMSDKIKLVGPVSLVIDYAGSSKAASE